MRQPSGRAPRRAYAGRRRRLRHAAVGRRHAADMSRDKHGTLIEVNTLMYALLAATMP